VLLHGGRRLHSDPVDLRGQEVGGPFQRLVGAAQDAAMHLEHMPAAGRDLAAHGHAGGLQRAVQPQRLAVQQFVGAGLDQRGRQTGQVGVNR
jgi:hypothetical protein